MSSDNVNLLSFTTNLTAGETRYTEKSICGKYISLSIVGKCDQDLTVVLQFSGDGINWDYQVTNNIPTGSNNHITTPVLAKWIRLKIQNNGLSTTTYLRLFVYGTPSNSSITAQISKIGNLDPAVQISNFPLSGFGELMVIQPQPQIQYLFSRATGGNMLTETWALPYPDIKTWSTNTITGVGATLTASGGMIRFGNNFTLLDRAILYGSTYRYKSGQAIDGRFTSYFVQPQYNVASTGYTTQLVGIGNVNTSTYRPNDFFGFGHVYETDEFCIVWYDGHTGTRTYYPRSQWNVDKADGSFILPALDFSFTQIFAVQMVYLGYGQVSFWINNPNTGLMSKVHYVNRVNTTTSNTNISDPSVGLVMFQENESGVITSTADGEIGSGSFGMFSEGLVAPSNVRISAEGVKTGISTETAILSIRCDSTFYSLTNHYPLDIDFLSASSDGTKSVIFRMYRNATLSGESWNTPQPNLVPFSYDTSGIYVSGGIYIFGFNLAKVDNTQIDLSGLHTHMDVSDVITITAQSTSSTDIYVSTSCHIH